MKGGQQLSNLYSCFHFQPKDLQKIKLEIAKGHTNPGEEQVVSSFEEELRNQPDPKFAATCNAMAAICNGCSVIVNHVVVSLSCYLSSNSIQKGMVRKKAKADMEGKTLVIIT